MDGLFEGENLETSLGRNRDPRQRISNKALSWHNLLPSTVPHSDRIIGTTEPHLPTRSKKVLNVEGVPNSYFYSIFQSFYAGFRHQNKAFLPPPLPPLPPLPTEEPDSEDHTTSMNIVKVSKAEADKLISKSIAKSLRNFKDTNKRKKGKDLQGLQVEIFIKVLITFCCSYHRDRRRSCQGFQAAVCGGSAR